VGFESTIPAFEEEKIVDASDLAATVIVIQASGILMQPAVFF
jgi:hypothetical protein